MGIVGVSADSKVEVEGALEDGGVGDRVNVVEGEEVEGLFETPEYPGWEKEEEACLLRVRLACILAVRRDRATYHPCFP